MDSFSDQIDTLDMQLTDLSCEKKKLKDKLDDLTAKEQAMIKEQRLVVRRWIVFLLRERNGEAGLDGLRKITRIDNLEDYLPITGVTLNASQTFPVLVLAPELY